MSKQKHSCKYSNLTNKFQIFIFEGVERVLYPTSTIYFEAELSQSIQIRDGMVTTINADTISCKLLVIKCVMSV